MRVLLDECLPRKLKFDLVNHDVKTVPVMPKVLTALKTIQKGAVIRVELL
jgi:hypothetical protein